MSSSAEGPGGPSENRPRANIHDSTPPAEHLFPPDLQKRLKKLGNRAVTTSLRFQRACLYWEYALATPEFEGDAQLFKAGNEDLDYIITSDLPQRDKIRFGATILHAYEPAFRLRAQSPESLEVPNEVRTDLQMQVGDVMTNFLDGSELEDSDYGPLSESVAIEYLLNSDLFPYATTHREEANIYWEDNHDIYTLHPCKTNRIKKAPVSVKHDNRPPSSDAVVVLKVGRLSRSAALQIGLRLWGNSLPRREQSAIATRFAANIMLDKLQGRPLNQQAEDFIANLTKSLRDPLVKFASLETTPDYASNAEALKREIAAREKQNYHWSRKQPLTQRIQIDLPNS